MVRLIQIIKKNLKKRASSDPLETGSSLPETTLPRLEAEYRPVVPSDPYPLPKDNPYRRKEGVSSEPSYVSGEKLKALYLELHASVQFALTGIIHWEKIEHLLGRIVDIFINEPYNDLLLLAYSFSRQHYLSAHIANDVILTTGFARSLGFSREDMCAIALCAFTHDLGMVGSDNASQKGQQLSSEEINDIKQHPSRAAEIVRPVFSEKIASSMPRPNGIRWEKIASVVLDVHERENGQGYPRGIPGVRIHLWAKIIAVCDAFEALVHPRVFRASYSPYEAIKIIIKKKDILFDDIVVKRFIDFLSIYPVGAFVYLNSGEIAMVLASSAGFPTRPKVMILVNENREIEGQGRVIDLAEKDFVYIANVLEPEKEKEILHFLNPRGQMNVDEV